MLRRLKSRSPTTSPMGSPHPRVSHLLIKLEKDPTPEDMEKSVLTYLHAREDRLTTKQYNGLIECYRRKKRLQETAWVISALRGRKGEGIDPSAITSLIYGATLRKEMDVAEELVHWLGNRPHSRKLLTSMQTGWINAGDIKRSILWRERLGEFLRTERDQHDPALANAHRITLIERALKVLTYQTWPFGQNRQGPWRKEAIDAQETIAEAWEAIRGSGYAGIGEHGWHLQIRSASWIRGGEGILEVMRELKAHTSQCKDDSISSASLDVIAIHAFYRCGDVKGALKLFTSIDLATVPEDDRRRLHEGLALALLNTGDMQGWERIVGRMREAGWEGGAVFWTGVARSLRLREGSYAAHNLMRDLQQGGSWGGMLPGKSWRAGVDLLAEVVWAYAMEGSMPAALSAIAEWEAAPGRRIADLGGRSHVWHALVWGYTRRCGGVFPPETIGDRKRKVLRNAVTRAPILPIPLDRLRELASHPRKDHELEQGFRATLL